MNIVKSDNLIESKNENCNYDKYIDRCIELGVSEAKLIKVKDVVKLNEWVRFKCQFGCKDYGQHLTCPPFLPDFRECKEMVLSYSHGILVKFVAKEVNDTEEKYRVYKNKLRKTLARIERQLFLDGFYKAFSLHSGPCTLCDTCVIQSGSDNNSVRPQCKQHKVSRPAMEAMGIDVLETVKNSGWEPKILQKFHELQTFYGLILID